MSYLAYSRQIRVGIDCFSLSHDSLSPFLWEESRNDCYIVDWDFKPKLQQTIFILYLSNLCIFLNILLVIMRL